MAIDKITVARAAAMGNPGSITSSHDGLQRRNQATCRLDQSDLPVYKFMGKWLPVGNHNDLVASHAGCHQLA